MSDLKKAAPAGVNPRWWAWEQITGETSEKAGPYIIWISRQWAEFRREACRTRLYGEAEHNAFDNWLFLKVSQ